jgi:hypothetical protein
VAWTLKDVTRAQSLTIAIEHNQRLLDQQRLGHKLAVIETVPIFVIGAKHKHFLKMQAEVILTA